MKFRHLTCLLTCFVLTLSAINAGPKNSDRSSKREPIDRSRAAAVAGIPTGFKGEVDGPLSTAISPTGQTWGTWSYRRGAEADIVVAQIQGRVWGTMAIAFATPGKENLDPKLAFAGEIPFLVWWQRDLDTGATQVVLGFLWNEKWVGPIALSDEACGGSHPNVFSADDNGLNIGWIDCNGVIHANGVLIKPKDPMPEGGTDGPDPMPGIVIGDGPRPGGGGLGGGGSKN
jgi:hypothetical protein